MIYVIYTYNESHMFSQFPGLRFTQAYYSCSNEHGNENICMMTSIYFTRFYPLAVLNAFRCVANSRRFETA